MLHCSSYAKLSSSLQGRACSSQSELDRDLAGARYQEVREASVI